MRLLSVLLTHFPKKSGFVIFIALTINQKNGPSYLFYLLGTQKYPEMFLMPFYAPGPFIRLYRFFTKSTSSQEIFVLWKHHAHFKSRADFFLQPFLFLDSKIEDLLHVFSSRIWFTKQSLKWKYCQLVPVRTATIFQNAHNIWFKSLDDIWGQF